MSQNTLFGSSLEEQSIARIKQYEPPEGYYVAFSGGKDSIVILHLCKLAGVKFTAHYSMTTIDPRGVPQFIRKNYPEVVFDMPYYKGERTNFYKLVEKKGLPRRNIRWCCSILKETGGGKGATVMLGVRRQESAKRADRPIYYEYNKKYNFNPIVDWLDEDVWDFIHKYNLPYPSLYDEGHKRLGCTMCPLSCRRARIMDYNEYPERVKAIEKAFKVFMDTHPKAYDHHPDAESAVYEWVFESPIESAKGACMQPILPEDERG